VTRTLVIGGTRNLGPDLVSALLGRGDQVSVLNRGLTPDDLPAQVERLRADRSDRSAFRAALHGRQFDLVVDTTLYTGPDAVTTAAVLDGRVGRYVFWSTGQVYLVRQGLVPPFREEDYDGPLMTEPPSTRTNDHDNWVYGIGKRAAEDELRAAFARSGFPFVSLRMPMINSARDHYRRLAAYVHRILDGHPVLVPDDQDRLRLRHVAGSDVVEASLRAGETSVPSGTCVNISQEETLALEAMLAVVGDALGRSVHLVRVPRAELERRGLLPACSPWSGLWMSALANDASIRVLGMRYTPVATYLPPLVDIARQVPESEVPGYDRRSEEIALM
jgi:nucleoside-diphosphate-sugar epimerase